MTVRILDATCLGEFVAALLEAYRVYAPVRREGELRFDRVSDSDEVVWDYRNTTRAPKAVMFPQSECMIHFGQRLDRRNDALGDQAGLPPYELHVVVLEGAYGDLRQPFRAHPFRKRSEVSSDTAHLPLVHRHSSHLTSGESRRQSVACS